jgi:hypothetical protein
MRRSLSASLLALVLILSACDFDSVVDAVDRFDLIIQLEPIETYAVGSVIDAASGDLVTSDAEVRFEGADAALLVDFYADPVQTMIVRGGMFSVGLKPGVVATEVSPVTVSVVISAAGYETTRRTITFTGSGEKSIEVSILPEDVEVEGTASAKASVSSKQALTIETPRKGGVSAGAGVAFEATYWVLPNGDAASGNVTALVRYHEAGISSSLSALPSPVVPSTDGTFKTLVASAYSSFRATAADGRGVDRLETQAQRWIDLPDGAINPLSGSRFRPGDAVGIFAFDEDSGDWKPAGETVIENGPGKSGQVSRVRFATDKLGLVAVGSSVERCPSPSELTLLRNGHRGGIGVTLRTSHASGFVTRQRIGASENTVTLRDLPAGLAVTLTFDLPDGNAHVVTLPNGCASGATIALPAPSSPTVDVDFEVELSCTLRLQPPFNASLNFRRAGQPGAGTSAGVPTWRTDSRGRVSGGSLTIPGMILGKTYRFSLITPDNVTWEDVVINETEIKYKVQVPADLCAR